jgi:ATP-dependent RNA helicase DHX57
MDEVHERSLESDLLILLLRDVLQENKQLKLVLMSATADSGLFATYFSGEKGCSSSVSVTLVDIPGFTYPVRELWLEDTVQRLRDQGLCCCTTCFRVLVLLHSPALALLAKRFCE